MRRFTNNKQLNTILQAFRMSSDPSSAFVAGAQSVTLRDFNYARLRIDHLSNISEEELKNCHIDLRPHMHAAPIRVPINASLTQIFTVKYSVA